MNVVTVNLKALIKFKEIAQRDLTANGNGPIRKGLKQWAAIYRSFLRERFSQMSRGGWAPLKEAAILGRKAGRKLTGTRRENRATAVAKIKDIKIKLHAKLQKAKTKQKENALIETAATRIAAQTMKIKKFNSRVGTSILMDTGTLFKALSPEFTGELGQLEKDIPFGIRVGYGGPGKHKKSKTATVADIAGFHQRGEGNLPKREIIVDPPSGTISKMRSVMNEAISQLARDTGNGEKK
jgi:hypothetical protein